MINSLASTESTGKSRTESCSNSPSPMYRDRAVVRLEGEEKRSQRDKDDQEGAT